MTRHIERVRGDAMDVNAFVVRGPEGAVVVDGMLCVSDARKLRRTVDETGLPLAGVVITHPHPDHYAGLAHVVEDDDVPVVATPEVDAIIRRDDAAKDAIVGPMMGAEWPTTRLFPNTVVDPGAEITLGGVDLRVESVGPGESFADTLWHVDDHTVFAGDVAYNGMHAYLADGQWQAWLAALDRLDLDPSTTLHVGHGAPAGVGLLDRQRRYVEAFVDAVRQNAAAVAAGDHEPVLAALRAHLPTDDLLFLADLSIEPVAATLGDSAPDQAP